MTNLFEEYAQLEIQAKEIEAKKEQLRPHILQNMLNHGETKVETAVGSFSVSKLKKWTYPEWVTKLNEEYKSAKAKAESTKEATYEEVDSLRFTMIKL